MKSATAYPGAGISSYHNLVFTEVNINLKKILKGSGRSYYNLEKLSRRRNRKTDGGELRTRNVLSNAHDKWIKIKNGLKDAAEEILVINNRKRIHKEGFTGKMLDEMNERRKWKNMQTESDGKRYRKLHNELRNETEKAKVRRLKKRCAVIENLEKK